MISWHVHNSFVYVPLNANCLSAQGPSCRLGRMFVNANIAASIRRLCEQPGGPIVFDFLGIDISDSHAFEVLRGVAFARPVLFINVNELCVSRLKDDGVPLADELHADADGVTGFWVDSRREARLLDDLKALKGQFVRQYLRSKQSALSDWDGTLPSTPVHATKYYDVKRLCIEQNAIQIIATGIATAVLQEDSDFDVVVASSHTGSLIAVPVSILLGKELHCWTELGPSFRPKRRMDWTEGKGKRCLLVADVICMGTEARTAQAFMTASGSQLVGCAAVAVYLPPSDIKCLGLLDRSDLEHMGYRLSIPAMGG